ncbi:helix-turn-helix transcriptional regulator [Derxia gummosa]|uniref:Helix-turn-helix transcriptional regulator n=1 Tax=Derxia gummosa DSM 723 TaxID=1121388 RepID=A0A8B6X0N7_9BURK|nr:helix-turn-helix transcriptional regulator [Derxia gummosa]
MPSISDSSASPSLGAFLRDHRERIAPAAVGLSAGGRRRTPGLRREELAQLAGLSPTWLTWAEQGRDVALSADALARLANALRLTVAERRYLFELAGRRDPSQPPQPDAVPAELLAAVDAVRHPAYLLDRQWTALAANAAARSLLAGWLDRRATERNLLRFMFLNPTARGLVPDWPDRAARLVAEFRAHSAGHVAAPPTSDHVASLCSASPEFARLWSSQDVLARDGGRRLFNHPVRGPLAYDQITLAPTTAPGALLVMLLPVT